MQACIREPSGRVQRANTLQTHSHHPSPPLHSCVERRVLSGLGIICERVEINSPVNLPALTNSAPTLAFATFRTVSNSRFYNGTQQALDAKTAVLTGGSLTTRPTESCLHCRRRSMYCFADSNSFRLANLRSVSNSLPMHTQRHSFS